VFYKDWAPASINLTGLNNKQVRLEFTVNHCPFGQHFGYAYIDVNENISTPVTGNNYCDSQTAINLSAPPGFASYSWFTSDFKKLLGTGQHLNLTTLPPDSTKFAVTVVPYNGLGCIDTLYTTVRKINSAFMFLAKEAIASCPGSFVDLTQKEITAGSSSGLTFEYLTETLQVLSSPFHVTQAGIYYIRATNAGGCSNLMPVKITFDPPGLKITDPPATTYPLTVDISKSFKAQQGVSYSYYLNKQATVPLINYTAVGVSGKYYIKAETISGCLNIQPVNVTILPSAGSPIVAPNTFTPNNDGINDDFQVSVNGIVSFSSLRIYNRNGTEVFSTLKAMQRWDGNYGGRPIPVGTYYWVFQGYDNYQHKKVSKSSYITLIR
jgi:gliding motility-associated-like protein